ncbi:MAG: hypothetical protein J6Y52_03605 [Bacteroidales bacterium]|nr:hypothetical protein [Bacteroidales bacterium]
MALIDIKKLKEVDLSKLKDKASETFDTTKEQANTLTTKAIQHLLKGLDLDGLRFVAVRLGIGMRKVDLKALDRAYSEAFPHSTPLNVNKKRRNRHREIDPVTQ